VLSSFGLVSVAVGGVTVVGVVSFGAVFISLMMLLTGFLGLLGGFSLRCFSVSSFGARIGSLVFVSESNHGGQSKQSNNDLLHIEISFAISKNRLVRDGKQIEEVLLALWSAATVANSATVSKLRLKAVDPLDVDVLKAQVFELHGGQLKDELGLTRSVLVPDFFDFTLDEGCDFYGMKAEPS